MKDLIIGALFGSLVTYVLNKKSQYRDITLKLNTIMASQEQFDTVLERIDAATTAIAQELTDLKGQIQGQGLPADKEDAVLTKLGTIADKLEAFGKKDDPTGDNGGGGDNGGDFPSDDQGNP